MDSDWRFYSQRLSASERGLLRVVEIRLGFGYDIIYIRSGDQTGMGLGLVDVTISSSDDAPHFWTRLQGFGEYAFILKNVGSEQSAKD